MEKGRALYFLVHPGGLYWKNKDEKAWSIPKGEYKGDEDPLQAASREFAEETGQELIAKDFIKLPDVKTKSGKLVNAWLATGDVDTNNIASNTILIDWPPRSGKKLTIPEIDRGGWFTYEEAMLKVHEYQIPLLKAAEKIVNG